ncbi:MAG: hypothetical protein ACRDWI_14050 [Jiangellaceae bacterium]
MTDPVLAVAEGGPEVQQTRRVPQVGAGQFRPGPPAHREAVAHAVSPHPSQVSTVCGVRGSARSPQ